MKTVAGLLLTCLLLTLVACGGGGGSSGSSSSLPPVPGNAPTVPSPIYAGVETQATISTSTAVSLSTSTIEGVQTILESAPSPDFPTGSPSVINQTVPGPIGGSALVQGRLNSNDTGWVIETLANYQYSVQQGSGSQTFTENGVIDFFYKGATDAVVGFSGLTLSSNNKSTLINGSIEANASNSGCVSYTGNLSFSNPDQSYTLELSSVTISDVCNQQVTHPTYTISGRIYESDIGYATFNSVTPVVFAYGPAVAPNTGGPLKITGSNTTTLYMDFINQFVASIGLDDVGNGLVDTAVRFNWQTMSVDLTPSTGTGPLADVTQQTVAYSNSGTPVTLDGRDSHSPQGKFLTFQWSVVLAPVGSSVTSASLSNADTATPTFTPDVSGDYLVRLTVSDGTNTNSTDYAVNAETSLPTTTAPIPWAGPNAGSDMIASVGQTVQLDGSASTPISNASSYSWTLQVPPGSHATLHFKSIDPNLNQQPTFTPDVPGYYVATYGSDGDTTCTGQPQCSMVIVTVGQKYRFAPAVELATFIPDPVMGPPYEIATADLNQDGKADVVVSTNSTSVSINSYFGSAAGISAPQTIGTNEEMVSLGDFTGLGAPEVLTQSTACGGLINILAYQGGNFQTVTSMNYPTNQCPLNVAPEAGQAPGSTPLVTADSTSFITFEPGAGNTYSAPIYSNYSVPSGYLSTLAFGMLTGGAYPDIVATGTVTSTVNQITSYTPILAIFDGTGVGSYSATPSFMEPFGDITQLTLGNLSPDGLTDLVAASSDDIGTNILDVFYRTGSGGLNTTPVSLATAPGVRCPVITDLNGDGLNDLLVLNDRIPVPYGGGNYMTEAGFYYQQPNGSLAPEQLYPIGVPVGWNDYKSPCIAVGDVNGDGVPDLIVTTLDGKLYVLLGEAVN